MNALARYFLVFLLGWAGAIFTYSDLIYVKKNALPNETLNEKTGEPLIQTNEASSEKPFQLPTTARGRFIKKNKPAEQPKP